MFMKAIVKILYNSHYVKHSVSAPNGGLLKRVPNFILNYYVSFYVGQIT